MNILLDHVTTNEALRTAVLREIEWRRDIHSQDINVKAVGPAVTLTGFVHTFAEKVNAERAAKSVRGVDALSIHVSAHDSTVELTGTVGSFSEREKAECIAGAAPGIQSVVNRIRVT